MNRFDQRQADKSTGQMGRVRKEAAVKTIQSKWRQKKAWEDTIMMTMTFSDEEQEEQEEQEETPPPPSSPPPPPEKIARQELLVLVPMFEDTKDFLNKVETVDKSDALYLHATEQKSSAASNRKPVSDASSLAMEGVLGLVPLFDETKTYLRKVETVDKSEALHLHAVEDQELAERIAQKQQVQSLQEKLRLAEIEQQTSASAMSKLKLQLTAQQELQAQWESQMTLLRHQVSQATTSEQQLVAQRLVAAETHTQELMALQQQLASATAKIGAEKLAKQKLQAQCTQYDATNRDLLAAQAQLEQQMETEVGTSQRQGAQLQAEVEHLRAAHRELSGTLLPLLLLLLLLSCTTKPPATMV